MDYQTIMSPISGARADCSIFRTPGGSQEVHISVVPESGRPFPAQQEDVINAYLYAVAQLGLSGESAVFRRVFLSDAANQEAHILESALMNDKDGGPVAVSIVEQCPLPERKIALWAYHVSDPDGLKKEPVPNGVLMRRGGLGHLWMADIGGFSAAWDVGEAGEQTRRIFGAYERALNLVQGDLFSSAVRTWLFVHDVDINYMDMVRARAGVFDQHGMTADTHYVASTGIEGRRANPARAVLMDAYAVTGVQQGQIRWIHAPEHLGSTHVYGVTFERGALVEYGDRRHVLVSGTASIDPEGRTLHDGDIEAQLERTFQNIEALLANAGAGHDDVAHLIVYLRDLADRHFVSAYIQQRYRDVPHVLVRASVCRQDWLVEIECIAIAHNENATLPAF